MWPKLENTADLVISTEEILNGKLHFLCSGISNEIFGLSQRPHIKRHEVPLRLLISPYSARMRGNRNQKKHRIRTLFTQYNTQHATRIHTYIQQNKTHTRIHTAEQKKKQFVKCIKMIFISATLTKLLRFTAWKVSKYRVFSGPYFPVFSPNTGKYGPEKLRISTLFTQRLHKQECNYLYFTV